MEAWSPWMRTTLAVAKVVHVAALLAGFRLRSIRRGLLGGLLNGLALSDALLIGAPIHQRASLPSVQGSETKSGRLARGPQPDNQHDFTAVDLLVQVGVTTAPRE